MDIVERRARFVERLIASCREEAEKMGVDDPNYGRCYPGAAVTLLQAAIELDRLRRDVPVVVEADYELIAHLAQVAADQRSDDPQPGDWNAACEHIAECIRSALPKATHPVEEPADRAQSAAPPLPSPPTSQAAAVAGEDKG